MIVYVCVCVCGGDLMFIPWPGQVLISTRPRGFIHLSLFWGLNEEPDSWKQELFQQNDKSLCATIIFY